MSPSEDRRQQLNSTRTNGASSWYKKLPQSSTGMLLRLFLAGEKRKAFLLITMRMMTL